MKTFALVMLSIAFSTTVFAADAKAKKTRAVSSISSVCEEKAKDLAKGVMAIDFPDSPALGVNATEISSKNNVRTYSVGIDSGGKMDMQYQVAVEESGLQACYLKSIVQK